MALDPDTVAVAIKGRLAQISGLEVRDVVPDMPVTPMAVAWPASMTYDLAMSRGLDQLDWTIAVLVDRADSETAQGNLRDYIASTGAKSVKTAVEATSGSFGRATLGGAVQTCRVTSVSDIGVVAYGDISFLFAEFDLETYG